jgi:voltage-gated potassium channel Kch
LRPYYAKELVLGFWKLAVTGSILYALFTCTHSKWIRITEVILSILAVGFSWVTLWTSDRWSVVIAAVSSMAFVFLFAISIVHQVLVAKKVSLNTFKGAICAYLLMAVGFAHLYWFIDFLHPKSFLLANNPIEATCYAQYLSEMIYFSFVTLLTVGYGDIVPLTAASQTATIVEGLIGQFYLILFVARLVSVYASRK